jgi:hypothetical protein
MRRKLFVEENSWAGEFAGKALESLAALHERRVLFGSGLFGARYADNPLLIARISDTMGGTRRFTCY